MLPEPPVKNPYLLLEEVMTLDARCLLAGLFSSDIHDTPSATGQSYMTGES